MPFEKFRLDKKNVLITGAAGLLGKEHALAILEAGGKVILTDISTKELNKTKKDLQSKYDSESIKAFKMDVSNKKDISRVSGLLLKSKTRVDVLINNAAINPKVKNKLSAEKKNRLENFSSSSWDKEIEVGLKGAFLCSQIFGSLMASDLKGGVILNISSDLSVISPNQKIYEVNQKPQKEQPVKPVTYSVIKVGLIGLTRYVATYWARNNIRCNALSPGGVFNNQDEDFVNRLNSLIPLGRMAEKDEYRSAIQFLCSDASSYVNGQNIVIDGGRSVW
jgi:NAD(P)-dependent dehydrogenase (short-subunit alcohol dehydrogenase family)